MLTSLLYAVSIYLNAHNDSYVPVAPPNPNDGVEAEEAAGVAPVEAPPNRDGLGASPPVFAAMPNPPKLGVDDAPAVAPPAPNRLLVAGLLDAPPPKSPEPPALAPPPPPNSPVLGVLDPVLAVPKRDGDEVPVVLLAPPNSPPVGFGVLEPALLPAGCPNVKPDMVALEDVGCTERKPGCWLGSWLL